MSKSEARSHWTLTIHLKFSKLKHIVWRAVGQKIILNTERRISMPDIKLPTYEIHLIMGRLVSIGHSPHMHACRLSHFSRVQLCDPMDRSLPGSSVLGILQRILEWVALPYSRISSGPRDWNCVSHISCISRGVLYHQCLLGSPNPTYICTEAYKGEQCEIWQHRLITEKNLNYNTQKG